MYLFPSSLLNSSWSYYPCIIPLIVSEIDWFKFFVGQKENHFALFYHVFCQGNSMRNEWHTKILFACQILPMKGNETASSITQILVFWQRNKDSSERVSRQEISWVRNLSIWYIPFYCFIANNTHISLYIVFSSKLVTKIARKKRKRKRKRNK